MGRTSRTVTKDGGALVQYIDRNGKSVLVSRADIEGESPSLQRYNIFGTPLKGMEAKVLRSALRAAAPGVSGVGAPDVPSRYAPIAGASPVEAAAAQAAPSPDNDRPEPTPAQKEAGNYAKGHLKLHGLDISIENPAGTSRRPEWPPLKNHYGYIRRTEGADGDHVDVFIGNEATDENRPVFVIDQYDPKTKRFDEHKVILGAKSGREARAMYQANYAKNWKGFGGITQMTLPQFKEWLAGDTTKPLTPQPVAKAAKAKPKAVSKDRVQQIVADETKGWGEAAPPITILDSAEALPPEAKRYANYGDVYGYYDGSHVYLIAPNLTSEAQVREVVAHEVVGHYGVDRIVDEMVAGGWQKVSDDINRLRREGLGSAQMRSVLAETSARYPVASTPDQVGKKKNGNGAVQVDELTYAREAVAIMAERGIRNGIIDRIIAAARRWIRKVNPNFKVGESEVRALLTRSDKYLRSADARGAGAAAFSNPQRDRPLPEFDVAGNRIVPLSKFADVLYREISPADLKLYLPTGRTSGSLGRVYFSNNEQLATGQGDNRGALLEFDTGAINGFVNTSKPAWKYLYDQGSAEFISDDPSQQKIQRAVRRVVVDPTVKLSTMSARVVAKNTLGWLETELGWKKRTLENGRVEYTRPDVAASGAFSRPANDQVNTPEFKRSSADSLDLFHTSPKEIKSVSANGRFDGFLFFGNRPYSMSPGNVETYRINLDRNDVLDAGSIFYEEDPTGVTRPVVRDAMKQFDVDEDTAEAIISGKQEPPSGTADDSWDAQLYAARAAKALGYRAVRVQDEQGSAYMVDMVGREGELERVQENGRSLESAFSRPAPTDTFYSAMQRSVEQAKGAPKAGSAKQWKEWLDGAQRRGEFKGSERDWLGIDQWLDDQKLPVTREHIAEFIDQNAVRLTDTTYLAPKEMTKAELERLDELGENYSSLTPEEESEYEVLNNRAMYLDQVDAGMPGVARYKAYTLGGGQNYRELMMVLPTFAGERFDNSHHFPGMENVLTHIRFNERSSADGKPTLHIEEIQSDWHQAGRRKGYGQKRLKLDPIDMLRPYQAENGLWGLEDGRGDRDFDMGAGPDNTFAETREDAQELADQANSDEPIANGVPDAPLKQTEDWALLGFKRALRWAAENGFERVTWTTGEQQADRYDLGGTIGKLYVRRFLGEGTPKYLLDAFAPDGAADKVLPKKVLPSELEANLGKELAAKIQAQGDGTVVYSGLDLRVGGEGMKSFYDQMLPKTIAKYVKKWDGKIGKAEIETGTYVMKDNNDIAPETVTVHSIDITPEMQQSVMQGQPLFSAPAASVDDLNTILSKPDGSVWQRAKEWASGKWQDLRPTALGALTLRHVLELAEPLIPGAKQYADTVQRISADRNVMLETAGKLSDEVQKWAKGGKVFGGYTPEAKALFDLIHQSTIAGSDPGKPYQPMVFNDSQGNPVVFTPEALRERKRQLQAQIRGRPGEAHLDKLDELKFLDKLPDIEKARKAKYPDLLAAWTRLTPKAQEYYGRLRDHYENHSKEVEKALESRVKALDVPETQKRGLIEQLKRQFEMQRLQGVYFPLQRYGEFWISATDADGEPAYLMFENAKDWSRAQAKLKQSGFTINATGRKDQNYRAKDAPSGTFVAKIMEKLQEAHVSEKVQDQVYQEFLKSLPDLSMRKHSIHRGGIAGFNEDALRAFAKNAFHGAHQLSKLRYSHVLQAQLDAMKILVDNRRKSGLPPAEVNAMDALIGELQKRHDWVLSPTDSKIANYASAIGFINYLASGAAAVVNLTQGPMITFPVLGAQHGFDKAARMLTAATRDAIRTFGNIDRVLKTDDERLAFKTLLARGDIQRSAAHNLAGIAEGSELQGNPVWAKAMYAMTYAFQKAEEVNRQAAGIAAFRMAKLAGKSTDESIAYASEIINGTHYDFSNANRARFMQSAPAKVLLMFRQYALNTTWLLARAVQKSVAGESPEVKKLARRKLAGVLGMSALFSGVMGLPFMGVAAMVVNALQSAFGDDDEPFDFAIEFRNFLADAIGPEAARIVADGPANRLGADIASRVAMNQLWIRDSDRELEGQDAYYHLLEQAAGPIGGIGKNVLVGLKQIGEGHAWRGFETMMPKGLKDAMKAIRFETEGANTLRGDPLIEDVGIGTSLIQALGFAPTRLSEQYRVNSAVKNYEQHILNRRQDLLGALALAVRYSDDEARTEALNKIQAFNRKFPELALSAHSIRQSLRARARYSAQAEGGIVLNKRIAARAREEAGGFATQ